MYFFHSIFCVGFLVLIADNLNSYDSSVLFHQDRQRSKYLAGKYKNITQLVDLNKTAKAVY